MLKFFRKNVLPVFGFSYKKNYGEVIEDFMEHVKQHGRAIEQDLCKYYTKTGNMCAVGQNCKNPKKMQSLGYGAVDNLWHFDLCAKDSEEILNRYLKDDVKHLSFEFWKDLQLFHDLGGNWNDDNKTLTKYGKYTLGNIKRKWS